MPIDHMGAILPKEITAVDIYRAMEMIDEIKSIEIVPQFSDKCRTCLRLYHMTGETSTLAIWERLYDQYTSNNKVHILMAATPRNEATILALLAFFGGRYYYRASRRPKVAKTRKFEYSKRIEEKNLLGNLAGPLSLEERLIKVRCI